MPCYKTSNPCYWEPLLSTFRVADTFSDIAPLNACTWKSAVIYSRQLLPYSQVIITRLLP